MPNTIDYTIRLLPDTSEIKNKIKAGEVLNTSELSNIKNLIINAIREANHEVKKESPKMQKAIQNGLDVDTSKIEERLEFVAGLMGELEKINPIGDWTKQGKQVYDTFTNLQNTVGSLTKIVTGLEGSMNTLTSSFETFKNSYQSFHPTQFANVAKEGKETVSVVLELDEIFKKLGQDTSGIDKTQKTLKWCKDTLSSITGKEYKVSIATDIDLLNEDFEYVQETIETSLDKISNLTDKSEIDAELKKVAQLKLELYDIEQARLKMGADPILGVMGETSSKELIREVKAILKEFKSDAKQITDGLSQIQLDLTLPKYKDFIPQINQFVNELNTQSDKFNKVKLEATIDKHDGTKKLVENTENSLDKVEGKFKTSLENIKTKAQEWREGVIKALTIGSKDLEFKYEWSSNVTTGAEALHEALQAYFDTHNIQVQLDKEQFVKDVQELLEGKDLSLNLGGGSKGAVDNAILETLQQILTSVSNGKLTVNTSVVPSTGGDQTPQQEDKLDINPETLSEQIKEAGAALKKAENERAAAEDKLTKAVLDRINAEAMMARTDKELVDSEAIESYARAKLEQFSDPLYEKTKQSYRDMANEAKATFWRASAERNNGKSIDELRANEQNALDELVEKEMAEAEANKEYEKLIAQKETGVVKELDKTTIHIKDVINSLKELVTGKLDSKGAQAAIKLLKDRGIDTDAIKSGELSDDDIYKMLTKALMTKDDTGQARGRVLDDQLKEIITKNHLKTESGTGKLINKLSDDISTLFKRSDIKTETTQEKSINQRRMDLWNDVAPAGKALHQLNLIRHSGWDSEGNTKRYFSPASMENIEKFSELLTELGMESSALEKFKEARAKLGDSTDEQAMAEFKQAAFEFYNDSKNLYRTLSEKYGQFQGEVYVGDRKTPIIINRARDINKVNGEVREVLPYQAFNQDYKTNKDFIKRPNPQEDARFKEITVDKFITLEEATQDKTYNVEQLKKNVAEIPELTKKLEECKGKVNDSTESIKKLQDRINGMREESLQIDTSGENNVIKNINALKSIIPQAKDGVNKKQSIYYDDQIDNLSENELKIAREIQSISYGLSGRVEELDDINTKIKQQEKALEKEKELAEEHSKYLERIKNTKKEIKTLKSKNKVEKSDEINTQIKVKENELRGYEGWVKMNPTRPERINDIQNQINELNESKNKIEGQIQSSQEEQKNLIAQLESRVTSIEPDAKKSASDLVPQLREIKDELYRKAEEYIDIFNNADENSKPEALFKLQQILYDLGSTNSAFEKIKGLTDMSLYDDNNQKAKVDAWREKYLPSTEKDKGMKNPREKLESDLLGANRKLDDKKQELSRHKFDLQRAQEQQETLKFIEQESALQENLNELLEREKQLKEEIAVAEANKKTHKTKDKELVSVQKKIQEAKGEITNSQKRYALGAVLGYNSKLSDAYDQRDEYISSLNDISSQRDLINGTDFSKNSKIESNTVTSMLVQYRRELTRDFEETLLAELREKYKGIDYNTMSDDEKANKNKEYDEAREKAREYFKNLIVANGQLILKQGNVDINDDGTISGQFQRIDENIKETLLKRIVGIANEEEWTKNLANTETIIGQLREQKSRAMEYGGLSWSDLKNSDLTQEKLNVEDEIDRLNEKKVAAQEAIDKAKLENDQKTINQKQKEITELDNQIKEQNKVLREIEAQKKQRQSEAKEYKNKRSKKDTKTPEANKGKTEGKSTGDDNVSDDIKTALSGTTVKIDTRDLAKEKTLAEILKLLTSGNIKIATTESSDEIDEATAKAILETVSQAGGKLEAINNRVGALEGGQPTPKNIADLPPALQNAQIANKQYATLKAAVTAREYEGSSKWTEYQKNYNELQEATAKAEAAIEKGKRPNKKNLDSIQSKSDDLLKLGQEIQTSIQRFDALNNKVQKYRELITNAKKDGYLFEGGKEDEAFAKASANLDEVIQKFKAGTASAQDLEDAYRKMSEAGSTANQQINKNKRLYTGTNELRAVERQRDRIAGAGNIDFDTVNDSEVEAVKDYEAAYQALQDKYRKYAEERKVIDADIQKELRRDAAEVQKLGRQLLSAAQEAEKLKDAVANSSKFTDQYGKTHKLGDDKALELEQTKNLEASIRAYAQEVYGADLQNVKYNNTTKTLTGTIRENDKVVHDVAVQYNKTTQSLYAYEKAERESLTGLPAFMKGLKEKTKAITQYIMSMTSIYRVIGEVRKGIQYIKEIDLALVELRKVTDKTEEEYDEFLNTASKTAAKLGSTIVGVTEATATFAKLGYSMKMAAEMAEAAIVYKNVGDGIANTEDAANSIISTLKGFRLEASESMRIVDRFNEVGNRFAITSQGLGEALRLSASALNEGGNTLDESVGIITAANEVVNDPSSVGTALKTLTLRLRGSKTELEEMGEDVSDMATTTSQLQAKLLALTGGQVDIMLDENTFKSTTQILREMAGAWEDMTDIQQASALELMGGKRQANVLSALISNFDTAEKAIEASAKSAGSALHENEVYLDSIQGKLDQFTTATQAMWENALDSDVIKGFVSLGTEIVKIIDEIGLLNSVLLTLGASKGFGVLFKSLKEGGVTLKSVLQWINQFTLATRQQQIADAAAAGTTLSRMNSEKLLNISIVKRFATEQIDAKLKEANQAREVALITAKQALALAEEQYAEGLIDDIALQAAKNTVDAASVPITASQIGVTGILGATFKGLATSILGAVKAITKFLFTNPFGWAILATAAIVGVVAIVNELTVTAEELVEDLDDLQSEISSLDSEIESLNSELETANERMTELLAKPSLSFIEQEELANLQAATREMERQLEIQDGIKESKEKDFISKTDDLIDKWNDDEKGMDYSKSDLQNKITSYATLQDKAVNGYDEYIQAVDRANQSHHSNITPMDKESWRQSYEKQMDEVEVEIANIFNSIDDNINLSELHYGMSDTIDAFLDDYANIWLNFKKTIGEFSASDVIKRLFDFGDESTKSLQDSISEIMGDDALDAAKKQTQVLELLGSAVDETSDSYNKRLATSLKEIFGTVENGTEIVTRYFTAMSQNPDSNTIDGVTAQYAKGIEVFKKYKDAGKDANAVIGKYTDIETGETKQITWKDLFDEKTGETLDVEIAKVLQGVDETARKRFASLAKSVKEGKLSVEQAMTGFEASGMVAGFKLVEDYISSELNAKVFKDLGDELTGVIDTFNEFSSALENVANSIDLVSQAEAEMAYSGHVSVETALKLMQSTDNWNELLTIENGNIQLVTNATEILAESKLELIKRNLESALATVRAQMAEITATQTNIDFATTIEESTNLAVQQLAGNMAYLTEIMTAYARAAAGEEVDMNAIVESANAAREQVLAQTDYKKNAATEIGLEDLEKREAEIEAMLEMYESIDTVGEFESNYSADEVSGGNSTKEDVADDFFQQAMDYWENRISANQAKYEQIQNEIDLLEAKGKRAGEEYYREQIELENQRKSLLEQQKAEALTYLETLEEGSDEWWEVANTINDIEGELDDVVASVQELNDAIGQIRWDGFEQLHDRFSNLTTDLENIRDILSNEDMFDDEGNFTKEGVANLATYIQELEIYKNALADVREELADFQQGYEGNEDYFASIGIDSEQEYYDKLVELTDKQDDYTKTIKDSEQSVVEMYENQIDAIEEYIGELIDGYNDYIDVVKESIDAERD